MHFDSVPMKSERNSNMIESRGIIHCLGIILFVLILLCGHSVHAQKPGLEACDYPPDTGRCRAYIPRNYFNSTSGKCESFVYGGCRGNANNFHSRNDCVRFAERCLARSKATSATPDPNNKKLYYYQCIKSCNDYLP